VAMITNHSYLDNPTFRGMRQSLLKTFDEIYLLDLHGNSLKRETAPDGGPDENVFDIRQGVAIGIFVKHGKAKHRRVYHADLYGRREEKYAWLKSRTLKTARYRTIRPQSPFYFFIPRDTENARAYLSWPQIAEIFPIHSVGVVTARDGFAIAFENRELHNRILQFQNIERLPDDVLKQAYGLKDKPGWSLAKARQTVQRETEAQRRIHPILYRPFDVRYVFYHEAVIERPRAEVMHHMLAGENLALITHKREELDVAWAHALVTNLITEHGVTSSKTTNYHFPVYLYQDGTKQELRPQRKPNLADWLLPKLRAAYGFRPSPEQVLAYIYAVLYSPTYRQKYTQELRVDFPRVPLTADADVFRQMAELGQRLIACHLLDSSELDPPVAKYQGAGTNDGIERLRYDEAQQRVYINSDKYFEGVGPEMWNYQIGGYQVLAKYLKDRKGRRMDDPVRYIHIATAIARTIDLQTHINAIYPLAESNVLPHQRRRSTDSVMENGQSL